MKHSNRKQDQEEAKRASSVRTSDLAQPIGFGTRLAIAYLPMASLKPNPDNPRIHDERQIGQIARSIQTFGFLTPVVIDRNGRLVAGHGRVRAAMLLGIPEVPTIRAEHLTEDQAKAFAIADNKLTENSKWDDELLGETLKALSEVELEFSLEATGFEMGEIDVLIEGVAPTCKGDSDPADVLPKTGAQVRVSRAGDLWFLGRHRILCGNPLNGSSYAALMENQRAAMVFTDPSYNVLIAGHATGPAIKAEDFNVTSDEMSEATFTDFLVLACGLMADHSIDGSLHFLCTDWRHLGEVLTAGNQVFAALKNLCVWVKGNGEMDSLYQSQHELVLVFKNGKDSQLSNVQLGQHGRYRTNVWRYPRVNSSARSPKDGNLLGLHPDVKPVALVADALIDGSKHGNLVLDPFLGRGTTIIAAEREGRRCCAMEPDPGYVDAAVRRWQAFTGLLATHGGSARSFAELEEEAAHGE